MTVLVPPAAGRWRMFCMGWLEKPAVSRNSRLSGIAALVEPEQVAVAIAAAVAAGPVARMDWIDSQHLVSVWSFPR